MTGRERRCGWLDLVALRFAVRVNGITSLALTKLDVLSTFRRDPGVRSVPAPRRQRDRRLPGAPVRLPPLRARVRDRSPAGREELSGHELPAAAADYVSFVAEALGVPVTLVGTGASRDAVLALQP